MQQTPHKVSMIITQGSGCRIVNNYKFQTWSKEYSSENKDGFPPQRSSSL